ncbi:MAG: trigger factor [Cytophagaceae bacterium]
MEITLEKKDTTNARLKINLQETDYQPKVQEKVKEYSKKVQLKGFRPGKVPTSLINKMYGKSILIEEINHLLSESVTNYIRENKIAIIGEPLPEETSEKIDWETQKSFQFTYELGLVPDFKYTLSDKIKIQKYQIVTDDKVINETIDNLRSQFGQMSNPEESAEGDFIYGELKEKDGSFSTKTLIPTNKVQKKKLSHFIGLKKDDNIEFNIEEAFSDVAEIAHVTGLSKEEAAQKKGQFEFTVERISRSAPAELNQEFFDKVFGKDIVKDETEFRNKLTETVRENYERESDNLLSHQIRNLFVKETSIELPDDFLKRWLFVSNNGKFTMEQINKEYDLYLKELKWNLIKNRIAEDNQIKVENEEVVSKTKDMVRQQFGGLSGMGEEMEETLNKIAENYLQQDKGKNYIRLYEQALNDKILSVIKEKVTLEDKKVSVDEFKQIVENLD